MAEELEEDEDLWEEMHLNQLTQHSALEQLETHGLARTQPARRGGLLSWWANLIDLDLSFCKRLSYGVLTRLLGRHSQRVFVLLCNSLPRHDLSCQAAHLTTHIAPDTHGQVDSRGYRS